MIYSPHIKKAMQIAYEKHHGQVDKSGIPYIFHQTPHRFLPPLTRIKRRLKPCCMKMGYTHSSGMSGAGCREPKKYLDLPTDLSYTICIEQGCSFM